VHESHWLIVLLSAALTDNILLTRFLGVCPLLACSRRPDTALGLGLAMTFVVTATTALNYVLQEAVLVPFGLEHLQILIFIAVIATFVQLMEIVFERFFIVLYHALGIFLPLITVNCAVLGTSLFMVMRRFTFMQAVAYGLGSGAGWMLAILLMSGLRGRVVSRRVPEAFRGTPLAMILIGLVAMIFRAFAGMGLSR
jgi:Na+-transporting NADH:ubiquinone oxidoreductase subunit E